MRRYVLRRLAATLPLVVVVSALCFGLLQLAPGGPLSGVDPRARRADRERLERALGLDAPVHVQYARWLAGVSRGDLGHSLVTGEPVAAMIVARLPATLELMGVALLLSPLFGVALGVGGALRRGTALDHVFSAVSLVGISIPVFWLGVLAILVFSAQLGWLPAGGGE